MVIGVNDPVIPSHDYRDHMHKEIPEDQFAVLDLNNLNLSLDDFQKMSSGKYNAGELRLTGEGKLDIANNHKTWTSFNNTKIDAAESYAIRVAFAAALKEGGLDEERMADIRAKLGLRDNNAIASMKAFKPLTRQEVREIIDKNISELNKERGLHDQLKSYKGLHADYSAQQLKDIKASRNAVNAANEKNGSFLMEESLLMALNILNTSRKNQGKKFSALSNVERDEYYEMVLQLMSAIKASTDFETQRAYVHETEKRGTEMVTGKLSLSVEGGNVVRENGEDGKPSYSLTGGKLFLESRAKGKTIRIPLNITPERALTRLEKAEEKLNKLLEEPKIMPEPK